MSFPDPMDPMTAWYMEIFARAKRELAELEHRPKPVLRWPDSAAEADRIRAHALGVRL